MSPRQNTYTVNTIANIAGDICIVLLMLFVTPFLIHKLGDVQYGLFRVALVSVVSYAALLNLGLSVTIRRFFADAIHQQGPLRANQVLGIAFSLYGILAAVALICVATASIWLPSLVKSPPEFIVSFRWLLIGTGFFVAGLFLLNPLLGVLITFSRYDLLQVSTVSSRFFLFLGGLFLMYLWTPNLICLAISAVGGTVLTFLITYGMAKWVFRELNVCWGYRDAKLQRAIFSFSGYGLMNALGPVVMYQSQDILISGFLGPGQVTLYAVAAILITQMQSVGSAFASPIFPVASKLKAAGNINGLQQLLLDSTRRSLWAWGALAAPIIVFSDRLLAAWVGLQYASSYILVWILLVGNLGYTLGLCPTYILIAAGSIKWLGYSQIISAILALIGMVAVLGMTSWGLKGVAMCITICLLFRYGIIVPMITSKQLLMTPVRFFVYNIIHLIGYLIIGVSISFLLRIFLQPHSLIEVIIVLAVAGTMIASAGLWLILSSKERNIILSKIWRKINVLRKVF